MDKFYTQLIIFYYVAHFSSFTKTAMQLNCSKAYISKQMNELDRRVGTPLLHRSTRVVQLTLAGESLFAHAEQIVREVIDAEHTIASLQSKPAGALKITCPSAYAESILAPNLPAFLNEYPDISVDLALTGQLLNLTDEKIDVAIRLTHEPPLDRVAKRLGEYQMIICASSDYLAKHGEPKTPKELSQHECLVYTTEKNYQYWPFVIDGQSLSVEVQSKLSANNSIILLHAALSSLGVARLPNYVVKNEIEGGRLTPILSQFYPNPIPVYAVYVQSRVIPPKIHRFLKFLQQISICTSNSRPSFRSV